MDKGDVMIKKKDVQRVPDYAWNYKMWVVTVNNGVWFYGAYGDDFADAITEALQESHKRRLIIE